ncbi:MAG: hypothetical protein QG577_1554 [Thermodesulfobacteriota bacterium]|nr:hypothetical protein [Thermodesulfobacteriota bacterium]
MQASKTSPRTGFCVNCTGNSRDLRQVSIFFSPQACLHVSLVLPRESELGALFVVLDSEVTALDLIVFPKKVICQFQNRGGMKHSADG